MHDELREALAKIATMLHNAGIHPDVVKEPESEIGMTQCLKLGYKVGDRFVFIKGDCDCVRIGEFGSVIELFDDNGTIAPKFKWITGKCEYNQADGSPGAYVNLDCVLKLAK